MAPKPDRLAFIFVMAVAVAMTILAITTWAAPPNPKSASAESIQSSEVIYRPQYLNLH